MREKSINWRLLSAFAASWFLIPSCARVTVPNTRECTPAGLVTLGADCAETNTGKISQMTYEEFMEWLEPQEGRGGAICRSDEDFTKQKTALEQACALLKNRCTPEMKEAISKSFGTPKKLIDGGRKKKADLRMNEAIDPAQAPIELPLSLEGI